MSQDQFGVLRSMSELPVVEKVYRVQRGEREEAYFSLWKDGEWKTFDRRPEFAANCTRASSVIRYGNEFVGWYDDTPQASSEPFGASPRLARAIREREHGPVGHRTCLGSWLSDAFVWAHSPEGATFWREVAYALRDGALDFTDEQYAQLKPVAKVESEPQPDDYESEMAERAAIAVSSRPDPSIARDAARVKRRTDVQARWDERRLSREKGGSHAVGSTLRADVTPEGRGSVTNAHRPRHWTEVYDTPPSHQVNPCWALAAGKGEN